MTRARILVRFGTPNRPFFAEFVARIDICYSQKIRNSENAILTADSCDT
jgi:hypothetical protein